MKNFLIYIFGMLFTLYIMIMYVTPQLFFLFAVQAAVFVFLFFICVVMRLGIKVHLQTETKTVYTNNELPLILKVENPLPFPVSGIRVKVTCKNSFGGPDFSQWIYVYADARTQATVRFFLESCWCGLLRVEIKKIAVSDFLHVFRFSYKIRESVQVPVYPRITPVSFEVSPKVREFMGENDIYSREKEGDDPSEVFDIRPMRPGDRMQQVHWKLTARTGEMMVKVFSRSLGYPVVVFLNFGLRTKVGQNKKEISPAAQLSGIITAGLSVCQGLVTAGCFHYCAWFDQKMQMIRFPVESEKDVLTLSARLLGAQPCEMCHTERDLYGKAFGADSFCTFLAVRSTGEIFKDGRLFQSFALQEDKSWIFTGNEVWHI